MNFVEFIGFVITFMAMFMLFTRKSRDERKKRTDPAGYEREQRAKKEMLEKMYGGLMNIPPPPPEEEEEIFEEEEVVHLPLKPLSPPIPKTIPLQGNKRVPKKEMIVLATIYGLPKGLPRGRI